MPNNPQSHVQVVPVAGASEVTAQRSGTTSDSTTRATVFTPATGKKARIIAVSMFTTNTTAAAFEVYFGTGANISTDETKIIFEAWLDVDGVQSNAHIVFPNGDGPVGAVDDVVSIRTSANLGADGIVNVIYREE